MQTITQVEAAERLGLSHQAIGQWAVKPGCPVKMNGKGKLLIWPDFARWRELELKRAEREEVLSRIEGEGSYADAKKRREVAEAALAELELERERGKVIGMDVYSQRLGGICDLLAAKVKAIPGKYSPRTIGLETPAESQAIWEDCARDLLTALSETETEEE